VRLESEAAQLNPAARSIADNSPDNIMLLDREGRIRFINRTVPDLTIEQVIGTAVTDYVPDPYREAIQECLARVIASRQPDRYETAYVAENGDISYWESRVGPVLEDGEVASFVVTSSNVTE
jgi:PAS domain S-box-containing protein